METGGVSLRKTISGQYEQAVAERRGRQEISVTGHLEGDAKTENHIHLHVGTKEIANQIAPAVNHALYKIDSRENRRGKGN